VACAKSLPAKKKKLREGAGALPIRSPTEEIDEDDHENHDGDLSEPSASALIGGRQWQYGGSLFVRTVSTAEFL
jgi:hypothetical protein